MSDEAKLGVLGILSLASLLFFVTFQVIGCEKDRLKYNYELQRESTNYINPVDRDNERPAPSYPEELGPWPDEESYPKE